VREPVDRLRAPLGIEFIAELTPVGAQCISQLARIGVHVTEGLVVVDRERTERLASARLGFSASVEDSACQALSVFCRETSSCHDLPPSINRESPGPA